jgi:hypothetical protein
MRKTRRLQTCTLADAGMSQNAESFFRVPETAKEFFRPDKSNAHIHRAILPIVRSRVEVQQLTQMTLALKYPTRVPSASGKGLAVVTRFDDDGPVSRACDVPARAEEIG